MLGVDSAASRWKHMSEDERLVANLPESFDLDALRDECSGMLPSAGDVHYLGVLQRTAGRRDRHRGVRNGGGQHAERVRRHGGLVALTSAQWFSVVDAFGRRCAYCEESRRELTVDHVIPVTEGGDHAVWNVVPACRACNGSKCTAELGAWCARTGRPLEAIEARIAAARERLTTMIGEQHMSPSGWAVGP